MQSNTVKKQNVGVKNTVTPLNDNITQTGRKKFRPLKWVGRGLLLLVLVTVCAGVWRYESRYGNTNNEINIPVTELKNSFYPEDPAPISTQYRRYNNRQLKFIRQSGAFFDLELTSNDPDVATIKFTDLDLSLFVPNAPQWVQDKGNKKITFVDREWNRQQVSFKPDSPHVSISGGDGFEKDNIYQLAVAKNCLNAGLWEIILTHLENGQKKMYYQGWFTLPMHHYKDVFESENKLTWWDNWHRLDHWVDPEGTALDLSELRTIIYERPITVNFDPDENIIIQGEQARKIRTVDAPSVRTWGDFLKPEAEDTVRFATFIPPGYYDHDRPWKNEYWRVANLQSAVIRDVKTPANDNVYQEIEISYTDSKQGQPTKIIIGGVDLQSIPTLAVSEYPKGFYMPMGIGIPPFYDTYENLKANPPKNSPYYSFIVDKDNNWLNHHDIAIDGPVMHWDIDNPDVLHIYLLSYERHTLMAHYTIDLAQK